MIGAWPYYSPHRLQESFDLQWIRTVNPVIPPVTLADVKAHARISQINGDTTINHYIGAATDYAEQYLQRGLMTQTWTLTLRWFADVIWLPMAAPLQSVTSVQYYDTSGNLTTLAPTGYDVDLVSRPGRILRAANTSWPALQSGKLGGRVKVTYVVGYTDPNQIPERIRQGIRLYVTYLDADRDGLDPNGERGRAAAECCWDDRCYTIEPRQTMYGYGLCGGAWPV